MRHGELYEPLAVRIDVGEGAPIVILPGFGMSPWLYRATAELLARRCRVVVPDLYRIRGPWRHADIVRRLGATLQSLGLTRVTMIAHSFAGGVQLEYAIGHREHIVELVFTDTLAASRELSLAEEALRHPVRILWMATPGAALAFGETALTHPRQLAEAGWWGFRSARGLDASRCAALEIPTHVLWANRDSIVARADGRRFAAAMHASFTVAHNPDGRPVDHDWIYRHPRLFVEHLDRLGLAARRPVVST
jgi:pimeloyl-ACP methyl ester carboxylesterase